MSLMGVPKIESLDNLVIVSFIMANERKHLLLSDLSRAPPEEFRRQMCCE